MEPTSTYVKPYSLLGQDAHLHLYLRIGTRTRRTNTEGNFFASHCQTDQRGHAPGGFQSIISGFKHGRCLSAFTMN